MNFQSNDVEGCYLARNDTVRREQADQTLNDSASPLIAAAEQSKVSTNRTATGANPQASFALISFLLQSSNGVGTHQ